MKESSNHKKGVMVGVIAALVLVVALGVTFAIYNYSKVGENQILVTGDIYMKYTGTNQINTSDMLPIDINDYYHYITNFKMTDEELSSCESYFNELLYDEWPEGSTAKTFCDGTDSKMTLSDFVLSSLSEFRLYGFVNDFAERNFIKKSIASKYIRNTSMTEKELSSCESFFSQEEFDVGTTARSFCEGSGTLGGMTFQEAFDNMISNGTTVQEIEHQSADLIKNNVIQGINDKIPYFEFKIEGVNDYSKDIWYEIVLKDGDEPEGRSERLRDDLLRFRLVEVVNGEEQEIFTDRRYEDISNERIYVNTISANTTEKITRTYRIYMWISDSVKVGVGDDIDYDMDAWNKAFASVKVNVAGDFVEKDVNYRELKQEQPASCFKVQEFDNKGTTEIMITDYDTSCGTDVVIPSKINGHEVTVIGGSHKSYNDSYIQSMAFSEDEYYMSFSYKGLTSVVIPNTVRTIGSEAFAFNHNLISIEIPDSVEWIDDRAFAGFGLTYVTIGSGIKYISYSPFGIENCGFGYLKKIQIKKTCEEIKNIPSSPTDLEWKDYPFIPGTSSPYGLDIYGYEDGSYKICQHFNRNDFGY